MITPDDYFGKWKSEATPEHKANANKLLLAVNVLHDLLVAKGVTFPYNPKTNSLVSGTQYGGFRPQSCPEGAPNSAHKQALAVDLYDPQGTIDLTLYDNADLLEKVGIYIEAPDKTPGWSHWSVRRPPSGRHIFNP